MANRYGLHPKTIEINDSMEKHSRDSTVSMRPEGCRFHRMVGSLSWLRRMQHNLPRVRNIAKPKVNSISEE
jgi:hypothetical protein